MELLAIATLVEKKQLMVQGDQGVQISHHESKCWHPVKNSRKTYSIVACESQLGGPRVSMLPLLYMQGLSLKKIIFFEKGFKFLGVSWHWFCAATKTGKYFHKEMYSLLVEAPVSLK